MRDQRFVALHRGGPLDRESHALLARWAAGVAARVLPYFERCRDDPRPADAIATALAWADGAVRTGVAMKAAVAAHAAARSACDPAAIATARAAGHAAATAHAADHCMGSLLYAMKALQVSGMSVDDEYDLQISRLPDSLRDAVVSGVTLRMKGLGIRSACRA